jgi:L-lactate utilization protein LutC
VATDPTATTGTDPVVALFRERLEALDGALHEVGTLDAARAVARELVGDGTVARWADEALDGIADAEAAPEAAAVSLIHADAAVAETGGIAFAHGPGRGRGAGLLPDRQIALVRRADLVRSVPEALALWFSGGEARAGNVVFAAGPSRTADIEQRMILGVHGPRSLDVILYGPAPGP